MSVLDIADEVAAVLEPDVTLRDEARAEPVEFEPGNLYLWPSQEAYAGSDTGQTDEHGFSLSVAWGVDAATETAGATRDRAITVAIVAKADALAALVRGNRAGSSYEWLQVDRVDYENLSTHTMRGFEMELSGYVYRAD